MSGHADQVADLDLHLAADTDSVDRHRLYGDGGSIQYKIKRPIVLYVQVSRFESQQAEALRRLLEFGGGSRGVETACQEKEEGRQR